MAVFSVVGGLLAWLVIGVATRLLRTGPLPPLRGQFYRPGMPGREIAWTPRAGRDLRYFGRAGLPGRPQCWLGHAHRALLQPFLRVVHAGEYADGIAAIDRDVLGELHEVA